MWTLVSAMRVAGWHRNRAASKGAQPRLRTVVGHVDVALVAHIRQVEAANHVDADGLELVRLAPVPAHRAQPLFVLGQHKECPQVAPYVCAGAATVCRLLDGALLYGCAAQPASLLTRWVGQLGPPR